MRNLFVKSRKICLNLVRRGQDVFAILPTGSGRQLGSWRVNLHDYRRCAGRSHNETKLKRFGKTATTAIGWGQEEGMDEDRAMWKEGVHVRSFMEVQKDKKILFERLFSPNKKINALTEVYIGDYIVFWSCKVPSRAIHPRESYENETKMLVGKLELNPKASWKSGCGSCLIRLSYFFTHNHRTIPHGWYG